MTTTAIQRSGCIEWCMAARPHPGQSICGDLHVVTPWNGGVLAGVIDGMGHGEDAHAAAHVAANVLVEHAGRPLLQLVQQCHTALLPTRGAVMTLMAVEPDDARVISIGIGNVEAMLFRANPAAQPRRHGVLLRGGVVGYQLPPLHTSLWPIHAGDVVVFATDGLRDDFAEVVNPADALGQTVERVMARSYRGTDDGLVLGFKYLGGP